MTYILLIIILYLAYYDIRYYRVPNRITLLLFLLVLTDSYLNHRWEKAIIAGFFSLIFFVVVFMITRGKIGIGDIKFSIISAIYLGFELWLYSIFYAILTATFTGLTLIIMKKIKRDDRLPFIPFLTTGIICTLIIPPFISF